MNTGRIIPLGVTLKDNKAQITVWAPKAKSVICRTYQPNADIVLVAQAYGYWYAESKEITVGQLYQFVIDGEALPDPVSRSQPEGVHGPSAVIDLRFDWTDQDYRCPLLRDFIIYELHVGTFSPTHDFNGIIERLPYLKNLGITAIEVMPVAQFPGERNWGYDGTFLFAVQHSYGGALGLQRLVDACHREGIAVILDVVYNHFGPEGNYLDKYGPYLTDKYQTPWGKAVNYDDSWSHGVRDFVCENVRMWFQDFHIDALRLDAVHAIKDFSPSHILQDIRRTTDLIIRETGRTHYLIAECDLNDRRFLEPLEQNGFAVDAQWLDEFHHALRVAAGEEKKGYYEEFNGIVHLAKAYEQAYVFTGQYSTHRQKFFGSSTERIPREKFIVFSQNHDQVGNRMLGERSSVLFTPDLQRLMAMAVMVSPFIPLLFMGEEWASQKPFLYFVSHSDPDLIAAVRKGRTEEFSDFHGDGEVSDPQDVKTFNNSVLDWTEKDIADHQRMFHYYQSLIALRKSNTVLRNRRRENLRVSSDTEKDSLILHFEHAKETLICILNFSSSIQRFAIQKDKAWEKVWDTAESRWGAICPTVWTDNFVHIPAQTGIIIQGADLGKQ
ncbi:malto-oligosyltrehalose trehalohydrolase [Sphingobacterium chuzhouense]|uniref:Malto-oligosyltrehalose trehalohydrolase n=1 Tax=Sphingobacterium chuzhouense TaxID=1742264 RepID=A0ABR7XT72_9SPHI|nr:malto-oligosyltrehalose trehalohydrolase [Sphingobacterium chuzhouense]MBD1422077.1 malto-oligosyltrehalose trehalohydrolase [Sphingobacterium chuzhouense]